MTKFLPAILYGLIAVMVLAMVPGCAKFHEGQAVTIIGSNGKPIYHISRHYWGDRDYTLEVYDPSWGNVRHTWVDESLLEKANP